MTNIENGKRINLADDRKGHKQHDVATVAVREFVNHMVDSLLPISK